MRAILVLTTLLAVASAQLGCFFDTTVNPNITGGIYWNNTYQLSWAIGGAKLLANPLEWHIHEFQYNLTMGSNSLNLGSTGIHFNQTFNEGELSIRFGNLTANPANGGYSIGNSVPSPSTNFSFVSSGTTLAGRSIVLHQGAARVACCNIGFYRFNGLQLGCEFDNNSFPINGRIAFYADRLDVDLTATNSSAWTQNVSWHIHEFTIFPRGNCASTGAHYNPTTNFGELSAVFGDIATSLTAGTRVQRSWPTTAYVNFIGNATIAGRSVTLHDTSLPPNNLGLYPRYQACNIGYYQSAQLPTVAPTSAPTNSNNNQNTDSASSVVASLVLVIAALVLALF